jgi:hypothetical protein
MGRVSCLAFALRSRISHEGMNFMHFARPPFPKLTPPPHISILLDLVDARTRPVWNRRLAEEWRECLCAQFPPSRLN